ncbi:MAG: ATP-binding cassette domain-containing protein [Verrucomicrobia bacterium]|nr:ATP-binding cassette domain-containing protein [Verrucomicrobiota bacterium]MDA1068558.1 ATP-binding cassette domain-containing protein [Verrucomicrobiota bacterium]
MDKTIDTLIQVDDLKVHYPITEGILNRTVGWIPAVDGVSFEIKRGETFSLVGESGCGKSTTAMAMLRMQPVTSGRILFEDEDITHYSPTRMRPIRRRMQMIYQDPFGSLNPRMKVGSIIGEPLKVHKLHKDKNKYKARIQELMRLVGLLPDMADRYPHEFSGGQRQRIGIARALALDPDLIICDEAVSALDVSIQAQVLNLLMDLQKKLGLTYFFISHDLSVVRHISHRVAVMYLGHIVEMGDRNELFSNPKHPYTRALLDAVPTPDPELESNRPHQLIAGEVPSLRNPPPGCRFHPRCPVAKPECSKVRPEWIQNGYTKVACHLYTEN